MNIDPKFTDDTVDLYNEYFNNGEHEICYINKTNASHIRNDITLKQYEIFDTSLKTISLKSIKRFIDFFDSFDYIVMHGYIIDNLSTVYYYSLFFLMGRRLCEKLVWIEWGVDLYNFIKEGNRLKQQIDYYIGKRIREKVRMFVGIFPPDCDVYKSRFPKSEAINMYAPYFGLNEYKEYSEYVVDSQLEKTIMSKDTIYIQVGHNAQKQLNHIEVLESLKKYSNENIKLIIPLSYGDRDGYADVVERKAKEYFGEKALVLRKYMEKQEYYKLINRVDIAIFNTYRQTALSNIYNLINSNVKIFMPKESVMYKYFNSIDIPIQKIEDIKEISFNEFIKTINYNKCDGSKKLIDWLMSNDQKIIYWENIYNRLREENARK